jgi:hypothetical protein
MFMDPTYLQLDDGSLEDKDCDKDLGEDANVYDISEFIAMDDNVPNAYDGVQICGLKGSFTPMEQILFQLQDTMAEITFKCKEGGSCQLCNHATSLF